MDTFSKISPLQEEMARLQTQAEEFTGFVIEALKKAGISEGMSAVDIGCGTGHVSFIISEMVGSSGSVVALDANPTAIEFCNKTSVEKNIKNVKFVVRDAQSTDLSPSNFDFAYSRFLLQHLKDPARSLKEMIRIVKPGGIVMVEDCDLTFWTVQPKDKYVEQLWKWYESIVRQKGSDPEIGKKLYSMFIAEGLNPQVDIYSIPVIWNNSRMWDSISSVLKKLDDSGDIVKGIEEFKQKKDSLFVFPLIFRVWARV